MRVVPKKTKNAQRVQLIHSRKGSTRTAAASGRSGPSWPSSSSLLPGQQEESAAERPFGFRSEAEHGERPERSEGKWRSGAGWVCGLGGAMCEWRTFGGISSCCEPFVEHSGSSARKSRGAHRPSWSYQISGPAGKAASKMGCDGFGYRDFTHKPGPGLRPGFGFGPVWVHFR